MITQRLSRYLCMFVVSLSSLTHAQAIGPDPTLTTIQEDGPFAISSQTLRGSGFGGATVYSPNAPGRYAIIAICPGFTARQSSVTSVAKRLASHGFVVATIDTNSSLDLPGSRGTQLAAALRAIRTIDNGPAAGKIDTDPSRAGVSGHSMGGGGTLIALRNDRSLRAGFGFAPFSTSSNFSALLDQASGIIVGKSDDIAPASSHAIPFTNSTTPDNPTLLCIKTGSGHSFVSDNPTTQPGSLYQIAWFKRYLDHDLRYQQFLIQQDTCGTFRSDNL